jgi:hypothetical protein
MLEKRQEHDCCEGALMAPKSLLLVLDGHD